MNIFTEKQAKSLLRRFGYGFVRETLWEKRESLQIVAQNNVIKTNYVQTKIEKTS